MSNLEYVVRPYQVTNAQGAILIPAATEGTPQRATLTWGGTASVTSVPPMQTITFNQNCCNEGNSEIERESDTVRIYQQDNEANYVDVARPKKVTFHKAHADNCDQFFNDWGFSDTANAAPAGITGATDPRPGYCANTMYFNNNPNNT